MAFLSPLLNLVPLYGEAAEEGFAVAALQAVMITDDDQSSIRLRLISEIPSSFKHILLVS